MARYGLLLEMMEFAVVNHWIRTLPSPDGR
jgi:hypothetical protein